MSVRYILMPLVYMSGLMPFYLFAEAGAAQPKIKIVAPEGFRFQLTPGMLESTMQSLYQKVGIQAELVYLPDKRGMLLVDEGKLDAVALRAEWVEQQYPNFVRVPESIDSTKMFILCFDKASCQITNKLTYVHPKGIRYIRHFCADHQLSCIESINAADALKHLHSGLVDSVIAGSNSALAIFCGDNTITRPVFYKHIVQMSTNMYHYVHKKHTHLVDKLSEAIQLLKTKNGAFTLKPTFEQRSSNCPTNFVSL